MLSGDSILMLSPDVVTRRIGEETILVPVVGGIGNADEDLYTLRGTGQDIWDRMDGRLSLTALAESLCEAYEVSPEKALQDVTGLCSELFKRKLVVFAP